MGLGYIKFELFDFDPDVDFDPDEIKFEQTGDEFSDVGLWATPTSVIFCL